MIRFVNVPELGRNEKAYVFDGRKFITVLAYWADCKVGEAVFSSGVAYEPNLHPHYDEIRVMHKPIATPIPLTPYEKNSTPTSASMTIIDYKFKAKHIAFLVDEDYTNLVVWERVE